MKTFICLCLVFLISGFAQQQPAYFLTYEKNGNLKPSKAMTDLGEESLVKLIRNNFAVNSIINDDEEAQIIKQFGKGNFMNPVHMNFLYIFETSKNIKAIEDSMLTRTQITPVNINYSDTKPNGVLDEIYGQQSDSVQNIVTNSYKNQEKASPFYIFAEDPLNSSIFQEHGISVQVIETKEMLLVDMKSGKLLEKINVESCVNDMIHPAYNLNLKEGFIYKLNTNKQLQITVNNFKAMETLLHEVCGLARITKLFIKGEIPNMISFYFKSLSNIDKNFSEAELPFVYEVWRLAIKRAESNFKKNFDEEEMFGEILFVSDASIVLNIDKSMNLKPRVLAEANTNTASSTTVLGAVSSNIIASFGDFSQLFFWFSIFMIYVLYYIVSAMWNMEIQKDSLLYAQFLTSDAK